MKEFIHTCNMCAQAKAPRHHPYGLLQPLPIFKSPWPFISMDFIIDLPCSKSFNHILVLVDLFTKMMYFIPITKTVTSECILKLFFNTQAPWLAIRHCFKSWILVHIRILQEIIQAFRGPN